MHQKLVWSLFLILLNIPRQRLHARNSFLNKISWKRIIKEPLKCLMLFFFWTQSLLMDRIIKTVLLHVAKQVEKNSFISDVLPDEVWFCMMKRCLSYTFANYTSQFLTLYIIPLSFVLLNQESVERKGKITKIWISQERKELFRWDKKHF